MLYIPIHKRTGHRYTPVSEERMNELKSHAATANVYDFELVQDSALNTVENSEAPAKKPKTKKQEQNQEQADNEQNIDSGVGSEPL